MPTTPNTRQGSSATTAVLRRRPRPLPLVVTDSPACFLLGVPVGSTPSLMPESIFLCATKCYQLSLQDGADHQPAHSQSRRWRAGVPEHRMPKGSARSVALRFAQRHQANHRQKGVFKEDAPGAYGSPETQFSAAAGFGMTATPKTMVRAGAGAYSSRHKIWGGDRTCHTDLATVGSPPLPRHWNAEFAARTRRRWAGCWSNRFAGDHLDAFSYFRTSSARRSGPINFNRVPRLT